MNNSAQEFLASQIAQLKAKISECQAAKADHNATYTSARKAVAAVKTINDQGFDTPELWAFQQRSLEVVQDTLWEIKLLRKQLKTLTIVHDYMAQLDAANKPPA